MQSSNLNSSSNTFHEQLLDAVGQAVIATDLDGRIIYWNRAAEALYGWAAHEVLGRLVIDVTPAQSTKEQARELMEVLKAGGSWTGDFLVQRRDGTHFPAKVVDAPIFDDEGNAVGIIGVSDDLTAQKVAERVQAAAHASVKTSELRLRSLVDATAQVVWTADEKGKAHEISDKWDHFVGEPLRDLSGRGWMDIVHPEDRTRVLEMWKDHLDRQVSGEIEYRIRTKNGSYRWVISRKVPVFDENGAFIEWVGTVSDIDDRKRAESALRESELRYRTMVHTAHEGIWLIDAEARTTFVNRSISTMLGYSAEEMAGRTFLEFVDDEDRASAESHFKRRRQGVSESYDVRFRRKDGTVIWVLISGSPFLDESGCFAGSIGMLTDITERKRYEEGLIEAKERAEELVRLKSTLLSNLSHEIRTPLTDILGFAEIISSLASGEMREFAAMIEQCGERLMGLLEAIMELAQLESGSIQPRPEEIDVVQHAAGLLPAIRQTAETKGLYVRFESEHTQLVSRIDRNALSRILVHLTNNSLKFTKKGGVTIRLCSDDGCLRIDVADTGIGIHESFMPQLFEDFKQESEGIRRDFEGMGLGLSITKRFVDLLGGSIHVSSRRGAGSTFTVRLPAAA